LIRPKDILLDGAQILERLLLPKGFEFRFGGEGSGSGGDFAWGEFVREDRRLELHFRHSLGLVRYHVGDQSASHESYMRELGARDRCRYPGFSADPKNAFHELSHDLNLAEDFLTGSAATLRQAAAKETVNTAARDADAMAGYVGDKDKVDRLRSYFREGRYDDVVKVAQELRYPSRMSESERSMVKIAQERSCS
jgi:hypothetical protein